MRPLMLIAALSHSALLAGGQYHGIVTGPLGIESSKGGMFQRGIPGRGGTYPDIPPKEVLRVVTPLEEVVAPYPGVCSIIWLHEVGEDVGGTPAHLQFVPR